MEKYIAFVKTLSVVSVVLAALYMLTLKGKMEKSFKYVIAIFTVAAIVGAGVGLFGKGATTVFGTSNSEYNYYNYTKNIDSATAEYIIGELLNSNGIEFWEIDVITDILDDGSIDIIQAEVVLKNSKDFERAADLVLKQTGICLSEG